MDDLIAAVERRLEDIEQLPDRVARESAMGLVQALLGLYGEALGRVLYTDYVFLFQTAGLILLVAMIGAIVLTLRDRKTSRHQNIRLQTERAVVETLQMMSVSVGAGTTQSGGYLRPKEPEAEPAEESADAGGHGHGH